MGAIVVNLFPVFSSSVCCIVREYLYFSLSVFVCSDRVLVGGSLTHRTIQHDEGPRKFIDIQLSELTTYFSFYSLSLPSFSILILFLPVTVSSIPHPNP